MLPPPFEMSRAKIDNAAEHIEKTKTLIEAYQRNFPLRPEWLPVPDQPKAQGVKFALSAALPAAIPMAAGDAIHNLRSALDIMACDVVRLSDGNPKGVYFPFAGSEDGLDHMIKQKKFDRAKPEAVELLKTFKPFTGGNEPLRMLHDLDIDDKHNCLIATTTAARIEHLEINGQKFGGVTIGNHAIDIAFDKGASFRIVKPIVPHLSFTAFGPIWRGSVIKTLQGFHQMTASIVSSFAGLFPQQA